MPYVSSGYRFVNLFLILEALTAYIHAFCFVIRWHGRSNRPITQSHWLRSDHKMWTPCVSETVNEVNTFTNYNVYERYISCAVTIIKLYIKKKIIVCVLMFHKCSGMPELCFQYLSVTLCSLGFKIETVLISSTGITFFFCQI